MKKLNLILKERPLTLIFALALSLQAFALAAQRAMPHRLWPCLLFAIAALLLLWIAWRVIQFRARLLRLLRQMVTGDFEVGLPGVDVRADEVAAVGGLVNRLAELMRTYDELRTRRIRQLRMMLQLVLERAGEPMILYDTAKEILECNAMMQGVAGAGARSIPLAEMQRSEAGKALADILGWVVKQEKSAWEGNIALQLPGEEKARMMHARVVPLKDKDGSVPMAVVFGKMTEGKE